MPYRERGVCIISVAVDAPADRISSLAGKLGRLRGVSVKTMYTKMDSETGGGVKMYNSKAMKAEEFIDDAEILRTIAYAKEHKNDAALIEKKILAKAADYHGLTHEEAAVLLECDEPELLEKNLCVSRQGERENLRSPNRHVCAAVSVELLCQRMPLLPVSRVE